MGLAHVLVELAREPELLVAVLTLVHGRAFGRVVALQVGAQALRGREPLAALVARVSIALLGRVHAFDVVLEVQLAREHFATPLALELGLRRVLVAVARRDC